MDAHKVETDQLLKIAGRLGRFGGWSADLQAGLVSWSDEVCEIHGEPPGTTVTLDEAIGYYAPQWRSLIRERFESCAERGIPFDLELQILTSSGRKIWVRSIGEPVLDPCGTVTRVQGASQDLSALKEGEAQIERLESRLARVLETMPDAFFTLDREWRFTYLNREATRLLERTRDELLGRVLWEEFPAAAHRAFWDHHHRALAENRHLQFEAFYPPLGRWFSVHSCPTEEGLAVYFRDITESRRNEKRFRVATEAAQLGVFDWPLRSLEGWVSASFLELHGLDSDGSRLSLEAWLERVHPEDRERIRAQIRHTIRLRGHYESEFRIVSADGEHRRLQALGRVSKGAVGGPARIIGVVRDVTAQRRMEGHLRHVQKLEAVGRLSGGVAHDFNNLLTVIQAGCHSLIEDLPEDSPLHDIASDSLAAAEGGARLTRQLLTFSRRQMSEKVVLNLGQLVTSLEPMLCRTLTGTVHLAVFVGDEELLVEGDRDQLQQVVLNLVSNAADAITNEGRITLSVDRVSLSPGDSARNPWEILAGTYVRIGVEDTGCGMPQEVADRVFEPFFTTKPPGYGTGLGLPTVYGIVKESGGHVLVESQPGQGTTFQILLPPSSGPPTECEPPPQPTACRFDPSAAPAAVLLVEDDGAVRNAVVKMLDRAGHRVLAAESGEEALELLADRGDEVDLVVSDVVMADTDGPALLDRIRADHPGLPVVFMSGYLAEDLAERARGTATAFLAKPFTPYELEEAIHEALARWEEARRADGTVR